MYTQLYPPSTQDTDSRKEDKSGLEVKVGPSMDIDHHNTDQARLQPYTGNRWTDSEDW